MSKISELSITILSGETSGNLYGGLLARSILKLAPTAHLNGVGGEAMRIAGVSLLHSISDLSIMGVSEVLLHIPKLLSIRNRVVDHVFSSGASALILIDFPDFNLSVAEHVYRRKKRLGLNFPKIYYFVPPQVWIWRKKRINKIKKCCDSVFPLFDFEHDLYTKQGIKSFYAGHPITDTILRVQYDQKANENQDSNITFGLFPGSRLQEIKKILPVILDSVTEFDIKWNTEKKSISIIISRCEWIPEGIYRKCIHRSGLTERVSIDIICHSHEIMARSDVILSKSGTINLETALLKKPFVVVYKTSWLTWFIARFLVHVRYISLINILSKKQIVREFIQYDAKPSLIAVEVHRILTDRRYTADMTNELAKFSGQHLLHKSGSVTDDIAQYILRDIK